MLNTLSSFTPTALANTCTDKITCYVRTASAIVVLYSTNSSTVGNFKLIDCLMTLPVHFVAALRYVRTGIHNASASLPRNIATVIFRDTCTLC